MTGPTGGSAASVTIEVAKGGNKILYEGLEIRQRDSSSGSRSFQPQGYRVIRLAHHLPPG
jgi:hypothetical protein